MYRLSLLFFVLLFEVQAQIKIIRPLERSVYQRNNSNTGWVNVYGNLIENVSSLEAKLTPISGQGIETAWQTIRIENDIFTGKIKGKGGHYNLKIRGKKSNGEIFEREISPVGIGEVFIMAGQSNTMTDGPFAESDQVFGVNYALYVPGFPTFIDLKKGNYKWIYPSGAPIAFCGRLGDILVSKNQVPVLFMGAGAGGTSSESWYNTRINGQDPYKTFKNGIQSFGSEYGLRAVLWHQGEANSIYTKIPSIFYQQHLTAVIEQSRNDLNHSNLAWVVARVSWAKPNLTEPSTNDPNKNEFRDETIKGQNAVIETVPNVFQGPNSDSIEGYVGSELRPDGVHFSVKGQALLAELWGKNLGETFFANSKPYLPFSEIILLQKQSITFNNIADKYVNEENFLLEAKTSSNLTISYKVLEGPATIEGNTVKLTGKAGKVTIEASQSGNDTYDVASPVKVSFQVLKVKQTISFSEISERAHNTPNFELQAKASSTLAVAYKVLEGPATVEGNIVKLTGKAGKVTIEASQPGNDIYDIAESIKQSFNVFLLLAEEEEELMRFQMFPNPAQNMLVIESENEILSCTVINLSGNNLTIFTNKLTENKYQLDISELSNGIHIIKIQTQKNVIHRKLLINR